MFNGPLILVAYLIGAITIFSGIYHSDVVLVLGLTCLFVWDWLYLRHPKSFIGRTVDGTNDSVTRARTYISWFIGLYGVIIGIALTQGDGATRLSEVLENSGTPVWLVALPLILSLVSMLFVPLQLSSDQDDGNETPNSALKSLFFLVIYLQKAVLILIGNIGLRVLSAWA